ncbi:MAG: SCE4755 family polysaccharide monooxygenase-like protein [Polyangiaceae bacterium]
MKATALASFAAASIALVSIPASAHSILVTPPPIGQDDGAKSGPCGCYFGDGPQDPADDASPAPCPQDYQVTTLTAGAPLKIQWKETINHSGKFRFAITSKTPESATKADMDAGVLVEIDDTNATAGATLSQMVTVPSEPCDLCTIQLRQYMAGASSPYYYSCAAVKIVAPDPGMGGGGAGGGTTTGAGASSSGGSGAGASSSGGAPFSTGAGKAEPQPEIKSSCAVSPSFAGDSSASLSLVAAGLAVSALARRRHRRSVFAPSSVRGAKRG